MLIQRIILDHGVQLSAEVESAALEQGYQLAKYCDTSAIGQSDALLTIDNAKPAIKLMLDDKVSTLQLDFNQGEVGYRAKRVSKSNELIARALGVKPHYRPQVIDATAGMGRDALIMASLGCQVQMIERTVPIYWLLSQSLAAFVGKTVEENRVKEDRDKESRVKENRVKENRVKENRVKENRVKENRVKENRVKENNANAEIGSRLTLKLGDSLQQLHSASSDSVIYLDPMFPERKKSALVKKEMRLFKRLAGDDMDADQLLAKALESQSKRVIVKRPKGAPALSGAKPSHTIDGKKFRFDVYLR